MPEVKLRTLVADGSMDDHPHQGTDGRKGAGLIKTSNITETST